MSDCTSPDWLQDAINAIQDLDTAQDLVDGVASLEETNVDLWANVKRLDDELCEAVAQHASLQQENERFRDVVTHEAHMLEARFENSEHALFVSVTVERLRAILAGGE